MGNGLGHDGGLGHRSEAQMDRLGRRLAYVLRHCPESAGVSLSYGGWADVDTLLRGMGWDLETLSEVVATDDKGRYEFSEDGSRIRALHGHSVDVDLGYGDELPPDVLFHGTSEASLDSIMREGILPMSRQFVHLSERPDEAESVGSRHGRPVVLAVDARGMSDEGQAFHLSTDGVWLTDEVPARFLHLAERNW